jgi:phospholipid/cholesterol/gamma-HCH transport system substrate-binding protein
MKVSNETKVGALTAISITLLILGFNYLKGKNILSKANKEIYAQFSSVEGIAVSNPVTINGLQVGKISDISEKDASLKGIVVTLNLEKNINIPRNSIAIIDVPALGTGSIKINLGDDPKLVANGDTISTRENPGILEQVKSSLNPTMLVVNGAVKSLDSLLEVIGSYFDPSTKSNFHKIVANLTQSSASLQKLLDAQGGALAQSLSNVNSVTGNLAKNNEKITHTLDNVQAATGKLANAKIDETLASLNGTLNELKLVMAKANGREGSLGLLLNDPKLYRNLESTSYKLNILLDDFRTHPKRYVNVSVFGKKDKNLPLTAPLQDDSTHQSPPIKQ